MEPKFLNKFVAFIDILGFKSKVESAERSKGTQLSDILDLCEELRNPTHVRSISRRGPVVCPESRFRNRNLDYTVTQISDCAVISSEVSPAGIINLLSHVSQSIFGLLRHGVMVRGYVTRGNIFHQENQFIGPGYQDAYKGEQSVRAFRMSEQDRATPFVEIDPEVERYIAEDTDPCVRDMFRRMTKTDSDHSVTVMFPFHHLTDIAGSHVMEPDRCRHSLNVVREWIGRYRDRIELQSPSSDTQASRKSKYYFKILDDLLSECDSIESDSALMQRPAVNLMYDSDLHVVPVETPIADDNA